MWAVAVNTGGGTLHERDPLGANTGNEDPWLYYQEPSYLDLVQPEQSLYLDGGFDPFNPGDCEKDGGPYDCGRLQQEAENGTTEGAVYRNGRLIGQVSLVGGISINRGYIAVNLPDILYDVMHDFGKENGGIQPLPTTQAGGIYFVEAAVRSNLSFAHDALVTAPVSNREARIAEQLRYMDSEKCANAFKSAGLMTPKEVVDKGITIVSSDVLGSPTNMRSMGLNPDSTDDRAFQQSMYEKAKSDILISGFTTAPGNEYKGRDYMVITQRGFNGTDVPFAVTFVHEMMHAAGAKGRGTHPQERIISARISITPEDIKVTTETVEVPNRGNQHDLTWMDKKLYDAIIENCAKQ